MKESNTMDDDPFRRLLLKLLARTSDLKPEDVFFTFCSTSDGTRWKLTIKPEIPSVPFSASAATPREALAIVEAAIDALFHAEIVELEAKRAAQVAAIDEELATLRRKAGLDG